MFLGKWRVLVCRTLFGKPSPQLNLGRVGSEKTTLLIKSRSKLRYNFEWDPAKAKENNRKHKVSFERATTVFRDANHISIFDENHSDDEDRWITLGLDRTGILLIVIHTFRQTNRLDVRIRIISARKANRTQIKQDEEFNP